MNILQFWTEFSQVVHHVCDISCIIFLMRKVQRNLLHIWTVENLQWWDPNKQKLYIKRWQGTKGFHKTSKTLKLLQKRRVITVLDREWRSESHSVERLLEEMTTDPRLVHPSILKLVRDRLSATKRPSSSLQSARDNHYLLHSMFKETRKQKLQ